VGVRFAVLLFVLVLCVSGFSPPPVVPAPGSPFSVFLFCFFLRGVFARGLGVFFFSFPFFSCCLVPPFASCRARVSFVFSCSFLSSGASWVVVLARFSVVGWLSFLFFFFYLLFVVFLVVSRCVLSFFFSSGFFFFFFFKHFMQYSSIFFPIAHLCLLSVEVIRRSTMGRCSRSVYFPTCTWFRREFFSNRHVYGDRRLTKFVRACCSSTRHCQHSRMYFPTQAYGIFDSF